MAKINVTPSKVSVTGQVIRIDFRAKNIESSSDWRPGKDIRGTGNGGGGGDMENRLDKLETAIERSNDKLFYGALTFFGLLAGLYVFGWMINTNINEQFYNAHKDMSSLSSDMGEIKGDIKKLNYQFDRVSQDVTNINSKLDTLIYKKDNK